LKTIDYGNENTHPQQAQQTSEREVMANNRLFLVHRPTGKYVELGKRMALGWYVRDGLPEVLQELYDQTTDIDTQDDFCLCMESAENQPNCLNNPTDWVYASDPDGKISIVIQDHVPYGKTEGI
jgi:hypothetical protein